MVEVDENIETRLSRLVNDIKFCADLAIEESSIIRFPTIGLSILK